MRAADRDLEELAGAILDGTPVDWRSLESRGAPGDRALVDQLRLLAAVRSVARGPAPGQADHAAWGHLHLRERIGQGAFGEVFRAWDTRLDREVALKLLPASPASGAGRSSIIEEGRLLARVVHPNVVTIYGADERADRVGLWMEYVRGRTLHELQRSGEVFSARQVALWGVELCRAVAAVHAAGLLHRDIKPQNVMIADGGRLVLMDFGVGRELAAPDSGAAGTPLYLAPEVLSGASASARSEVYSIGVLLFHLLTGCYPVDARNLADLGQAHARGDRQPLRAIRPDVPRRLALVIDRALQADPERRHASAGALERELAAIVVWPRARVAYVTAAALVLAAGAWLAGELWSRAHRSSPGTPALAAAATAPVPAGPVIAVLPFRNLGAEPDSDYFVDGLTHEIIRNLAVVDGLDVRSQTSSFYFKNRPRSLSEVGEQLRAGLVVEGSVQRDGKRLRISAQLVQVAGDVPLWSERFDRTVEDIFAIQDEISLAIVNSLRLTLGRGQRRYQTSVDNYERYLRGRALTMTRGAVAAREAAALLEGVIDADPAFVPAHAGLAEAYASMSYEIPDGIPFADAMARMRVAAERAIELDPLLAEAHGAMGMLYAYEADWEKAHQSFTRAIELNPTLTDVQANYAISTLLPVGRHGEAERLLYTALQRDPLSLSVRRELALTQIVAGRHDEAIGQLEHIVEVDPGYHFAKLFLGRALTFAGRFPEALALWEPRKQDAGVQHWMAYAYVMSGQRAEAERLVGLHDHPYRRAIFRAALGDRDGTFAELDRAADVLPHRVRLLLVYPEMALLQGDPRLEALRSKLRLP